MKRFAKFALAGGLIVLPVAVGVPVVAIALEDYPAVPAKGPYLPSSVAPGEFGVIDFSGKSPTIPEFVEFLDPKDGRQVGWYREIDLSYAMNFYALTLEDTLKYAGKPIPMAPMPIYDAQAKRIGALVNGAYIAGYAGPWPMDGVVPPLGSKQALSPPTTLLTSP